VPGWDLRGGQCTRAMPPRWATRSRERERIGHIWRWLYHAMGVYGPVPSQFTSSFYREHDWGNIQLEDPSSCSDAVHIRPCAWKSMKFSFRRTWTLSIHYNAWSRKEQHSRCATTSSKTGSLQVLTWTPLNKSKMCSSSGARCTILNGLEKFALEEWELIK
jgi:hypothetical protein